MKHLLASTYRQLAGLGERAASSRWGVAAFEETHRDIHTFTRRTGALPEQREGEKLDYRSLLHRDGSVLSFVPLEVRQFLFPSKSVVSLSAIRL